MTTPTLPPALPPLPVPTGPVLLGVVPASGPTAGGNTVQLVGLGLGGATSVLFGGTSATVVGQDPLGLTVTVLAPAHAAGAVQVTVTNAGGTSNPASYVYLAPGAPAARPSPPTRARPRAVSRSPSSARTSRAAPSPSAATRRPCWARTPPAACCTVSLRPGLPPGAMCRSW